MKKKETFSYNNINSQQNASYVQTIYIKEIKLLFAIQ